MKRVNGSSSHLLILSALIAVYFIVGVQYAALTPRWQVPDEPAHYNYIRYIIEQRALPELDPGEYQQGYLAELTSRKFPPELSVDSLQYESWQPPLYYLLAAPIYLLTGGALLPLRLFSLCLGASVIVFTYLAVREAAGEDAAGVAPLLALTAAGFVAFIPQHVAMLAGIDNDSLSELVIAAGLWWILRLNRRGLTWRGLAALSALVGAAFLTKSHAYVLAPTAGLLLLLKWRDAGWAGWRAFVRQAALVFIPALLAGGLFWGRNLALYGWPDFMATIRHDQVVADQPRTKDWIAQYGAPEVARRFLQTTFHSFWGQFGWMGVPMPDKFYWGLEALTAALVLGFVVAGWGWARGSGRPAQAQTDAAILLAVAGLLILGLYLYYNLTYVQHQGRYLFPALIPISTAAALGLRAWGRLLERGLARLRPGRPLPLLAWCIPAAVLLSLAALDLYALYRFVIPSLT